MPDKTKILKELDIPREAGYLIPDRIPKLGECNFQDYFVSVIGSTLYDKFMRNYTQKMWNIPGDDLQTSMIWADRVKDDYDKSPYDPIKYGDKDTPLANGTFCVYPEGGWSWVWEKMAKGATIIKGEVAYLALSKRLWLRDGRNFNLKDYDIVVNTLSPDVLFGVSSRMGVLPYSGRMIIPIVLPVDKVFPDGIESFHYSGAEPQTRLTEMKNITKQEIKGTLLILEVPVIGESTFLPDNVRKFLEERNLYEKRCYPEQSEKAFNIYAGYMKFKSMFDNLYFCGRLAEFKYYGMAETIKSAYELIKGL
jgi:UDP-galactopyranose mutase